MNNKLFYSDVKSVQVLLALMKAHGIKRVITSPGTSNASVVISVQNDPWFEVFNAVDERHAAYLACGMSGADNNPTAIVCTGATASRNYMPGLTEAYYRKLPILAITCSQVASHCGNLYGQFMDRSVQPKDVVKYSYHCALIKDNEDFNTREVELNKAILELFRHGGGPVHINLETPFSAGFSTEKLPTVKKLTRVQAWDKNWPELDAETRVAVWIGSHKPFTPETERALEKFLLSHNAIAIGDRTSSYKGTAFISGSLVELQNGMNNNLWGKLKPELVIQIGEISGDYQSVIFMRRESKRVWRVSEDGEIRDLLGKLETAFEMPEQVFFEHYLSADEYDSEYRCNWIAADKMIRENIPELPFSNPYIARVLAEAIPENSVVHVGILNSLRAWNYFNSPKSVDSMSNVGGFGIDGCMSALIGASFINRERPHFIVLGDLSFFYDLNAMGNRSIGSNLRIVIVNNGLGEEFKNHLSPLSTLGDAANANLAAQGHFGCMSRLLVKHFAEDLGFKYFAADSKETLQACLSEFSQTKTEKPMVLECFTTIEEENAALKIMSEILVPTTSSILKTEIRKCVGAVLPNGLKSVIKNAIGR